MLALLASQFDDSPVKRERVGGWPLVLGGVLGAVLVITALFAVADILTLHIPSPGATGVQFRTGFYGGHISAWNRVSVILQRGAGGLLGAFAAWVAFGRQRVARPPEQVSNLA